ncbi:hypothetical protein [Jiangella rhizosphaerae]|uniref:Uncharacterized protein n=1 Tax=Jiangella rhizosphaerae TaxID=2293569 RepID=A0A418KLS2_9ACTN|nr:hypothetical protein [Jiangella rhizosphaerae]RIQ18877.1 hypothetical protein DY240_20610 [Jiangella rhizosphaerae]
MAPEPGPAPPPLRLDVLDASGTVVGSAAVATGAAVDELTAGPLTAEVKIGAPSATGLHEVALSVLNPTPAAFTGHLRLVATVADAADPWWLIPGLFYGENRPADCDRRFPRFEARADDPPGMVSDHWSFRSDRAATAAVFAWGESGGVVVATAEASPCGPAGIGFAHRGSAADVHVVFPFREDPVTYYGSGTPLPAQAATYTWQPGERVELRAAAATLPADRHAYAPILRAVYEQNRLLHPVTPWVTVPEAAAIAAEGLVRWHYDPDPGVLLETVGFDREVSGGDGRPVDRQAMHVGWVSGIPWAYALLAHGRRVGSSAAVDAATRVVDFCCANLSPSGTFWGRWERAGGWTQSWTPIRDGLHARTLGEATLFLLRAVELDDRAEWVAAARSNLDVVRDRQRADGNLGSVHDAMDGRVLSWAGASGLTWISAFCEAGALDDDGSYLAAAVRAGEYYAPFVEREFIHGAPEDVDLAPTSEDGYAAVMAYVALHRRTGDARWLDLARRAADWMLTFRYTYNVRFAPRTPLGVYGFATRGGDQASPSNQHLHAYGLVCTRELAELSAATGDPHYRERADEALACFRQLLATADGELNSYRGMITERYYQTECFQPKGMVLTLSHAWSAGVLLLGCEQVLGLD